LSLTPIELGFLPDRPPGAAQAQPPHQPALDPGVVNTLMQTGKYDAAVPVVLRALANEFRDQRLLKSAVRAPARRARIR
jgi:hypothetical protein